VAVAAYRATVIKMFYDWLKLTSQKHNQSYSEYKHVLANIFRSRYVIRTPPLEARSPGRRSNVENARRHLLVTNQQRARTPRKLGFASCCHSNATGAPIANPPNSAQLGAASTTPPSYIRVLAVVWAYGGGPTERHTDARNHNTFCVVYDSRKM